MAKLIRNFTRPTKKGRDVLKAAIDRYFELCDSENASLCDGKIAKPYTLSGLLFSTGISKEDFAELLDGSASDIAESALLRIQSFIEENALSGKLPSNAAMNSLKNSMVFSDSSAEYPADMTKEIRISLDELSESLGK